jgi:transaldolase/glucose-6-phosphate isomerase
VACSILGVNAYDQPDVQDAKERTRQKIDLYRETGSLGEELPLLESNNLKLYSPLSLRSAELRAALDEFLKCASAGDYIALNAFLPRSSEMLALLNELREALRRRTRCATMLGFGPRFLHSTGQLHKGGPDRGLFLEITASPARDIEIPHQGLSFGQLQQAQALGDYEALVARGRRILRVHIENERAWPHLVAALT